MGTKTCGTCIHLKPSSLGDLVDGRIEYLPVCHAPMPMWADDGDREPMDEQTDATYCKAYQERLVGKPVPPKPRFEKDVASFGIVLIVYVVAVMVLVVLASLR